MRKITMFLIIAILTVFTGVVCAAPANTASFLYTNPDGTVMELYSYGDESYNFVGDKDGYFLEKKDDGTYEYVVEETAAFFSSPNGVRPAGAVKGFDLKPETEEKNRKIRYDIPSPRGTFFSSGMDETTTNNVLVIAVDFNDVQLDPEIFTPEKFHEMYFDEEGISLNSYYIANSGGRQNFAPAFTLPPDYTNTTGYGKIADGVVKVKINGNHPDPQLYSNDTGAWRNAVESIIKGAFDIVDDHIDFRTLDIDGLLDYYGHKFIYNGELNICFVIAGYEASASASNTDNSVWAHMSCMGYGDIICDGIYLLANPPLVIDGELYYISADYTMYGAMFDETLPMGVGTLCHEIGHTFGLPDLYNTVSNAEYSDIRTFSVMASGSWCRDSSTATPSDMPSSLDPWCKMYLGWISPDEMIAVDADDEQTIELVSRNSAENGYRYILVMTNEPDEYYILENITFEGFDKALKYHEVFGVTEPGILVWHIDDSVINARLGTNDVNGYEDAGIKVVRMGKGLTDFNNYNSPLWAHGLNKIPFFGATSYPQSKLNTYSSSSDSGVNIQFESAPADKMTISIGKKDVNTAVYAKNNKIAVRLFNNSDSELAVSPIAVSYGEDCVDDVVVFDELTIPTGNSNSTTKKTFDYDSEFRIFNFDLSDMSPVTESTTYK